MLLRAGRWAEACACLESIPSWRRQPAPLGWKTEAIARAAGVDAVWPFLAELAWMAPQRASALVERLEISELTALMRSFNGEFEGEGTAIDFAWFPAWLLIVQPWLSSQLRFAHAGSGTAPERCAGLVLKLLALERQGRHNELVEGRRRLRDAHGMLFRRYMESRAPR